MARQHTSVRSLKLGARGALVGLGLLILFANLDEAAGELSNLLGSAVGEGLAALPCVALAASHTLQSYALDHQRLLEWLLQVLVGSPQLFTVVAGYFCG